MEDQVQIVLLPLDNRPVSYLLPKQIAEFSGTHLILPERNFLGDLNNGSDLDYLGEWLCDVCKGLINQTPMAIVSLDNWVYGGLIQSRRHSLSLGELKKRVEALCATSLRNIYAFSSIMRIANYNSSEEEKNYWQEYGKNISRWSELMHRVGQGIKEGYSSNEELIETWYESSKTIPSNVLADYKAHRDKNFTVNLMWLESLHEHCFEYLIFSCDDSSKYGMNVIEREYLKKEINKHHFKKSVKVISGTDEIPLVFLAKAILSRANIKPTVSVFFSNVNGKNQVAKYESNTIYESVLNQIKSLDLEIKDLKDSDIILCVHLAGSIQGDHVFGEKSSATKKNVEATVKLLEETTKPFILIDLAYANGADPDLISGLLTSKINFHQCYGYAGWGTSSNSIGSGLSMGVTRWISEKNSTFNAEAFKKCLLVRFLDDYAYQSQIRHINVSEEEINKKIEPYVQTFSKLLGVSDINIQCSLPWKRSFEIEINVL